MPRAVGCRDQNDFGADEEFGFAAPIVSNHAYATRAGVEIGYRLLPRVYHGGDPGLKIFDPQRGRYAEEIVRNSRFARFNLVAISRARTMHFR